MTARAAVPRVLAAARAARPGTWRLVLAGLVLALIVIAYFPFSWSPPRTVPNQVTRNASGALVFGEMNRADTPGPPDWLADVRATGQIQVQLLAEPQSAQGNASIIMLASNYWQGDFGVGQVNAELLVWLRRPGSDQDGNPAFSVPGVFRPGQWSMITVSVAGGTLRISVDGRTRLTARVPAGFARTWSPGQVALGDEVHGGDPWAGQLRLAAVRTPHYAVDYVRPGTLAIPAAYLYVPDHLEPWPPTDIWQWLTASIDLLTFIPFGFVLVLARRRAGHPRLAGLAATVLPAAVLAAALALALAAGKWLFAGRHTSVLNVVVQVAGAAIGAWLAARLAAGGRRGPRRSGRRAAAASAARQPG